MTGRGAKGGGGRGTGRQLSLGKEGVQKEGGKVLKMFGKVTGEEQKNHILSVYLKTCTYNMHICIYTYKYI